MKKLKHFQEGRGYSREDWDDVDSPELTDEQIAQGLPMSEAMPEVYAALLETMRKRGPAKSKTPVSIPSMTMFLKNFARPDPAGSHG